MAQEVGNIHIGLYVDVGESRRFTQVANVVEQSSRRMNSALGNTSSAVRGLRGQMSQSMQFRIAQNSLRDLTRATDATTQLRSAIVGIASLTTGSLTGAFSAAYLVQTADKARLLSNQIKTVTNSTAEFGAIQESLFSVSQRTRSSYEATTTLYSRMARATDHFGFSQEKLLRTTETIQKAFAIGGASPQEAQGAAIQLSQGIASNRFSGEEFRSVAENAPVLLRGIAESLGVNIGKLREMAHAGELTAQVVTEAILKSSADIDAAFGKMVPTVAQSWTLLNNAIIRYTGESDEAYGVTEKIASSIAGLAENLEDVMWWVTRVTAALGLLYAARKITLSAQGAIGNARDNTAQAREQASALEDNGQAMRNRVTEINQEIADANRAISDAENAAIAKNASAVNAAKEKEYQAVQRLNELEKQRDVLTRKMGDGRSAQLVKLQSEVDLARQRVRDDQLRVVQAQEAAAAEERVLRARQAQRLARADQVVTDAGTRVTAASSRVAEAQAAIAKERELAKVRLANEMDARRQSLVTSTQRLKGVQSQIAELRAISDLSGFDQAYGKQYNRLLEQQQKAIISTGTLRKEISSLEEKMVAIDAGASSGRGISSAMAKQAAAVKEVEKATAGLAKAEAARATIAATPISGKSLDSRIAAEVKELDRYQRSVTALQSKMQDLRQTTASTFSGGTARKMISDIDALDKKIITAQTSLRSATEAVAASQNGNAGLLTASLAAQERAARQVNVLQQEATNLLDAQVVNTNRLAVAQARVNLLRRAGAGFLNAMGGAWGLGITAALIGATALMAKFAANAAHSAQETEKITRILRDMGYLTEEAANAMDEFGNSVAGRQVSKLQVELKNFQADAKKTIDELKDIDVEEAIRGGFGSLEFDTGDADEMKKVFESFYISREGAVDQFTGDIQRIRDEMVKSRGMSDELRKSLEDIALANPALSSTALQLITFGDRLNAIGKAVGDWTDNLKKLREEAAKLPQERYWNTRTQAAENQRKIEDAKNAVVTTLIDEANLNDSEKRIKSIMEEIVKGMDKAGQTLNSAAVRAEAEQIFAAETASKAVSGFTDRVINAESGGRKNARPLNADGTRRSSAFGLGQFVDGTWLEQFKKHFPERSASMLAKYGKEAVDAEILALRSNSDDSKALIEAYARHNAQILQKAGLSVDEVALQLAHFLGPQGAINVLKAAPGTAVSSVLGANAIKANPEVLGNGATVDDAIAYAQKRAGLNTSGTQRIESREKFTNALGEQQRLLDALLAETGIRANLNPLINDHGRAISTIETAQKLLNEAQEQGTAAGLELKTVQQLLKGDFSSLTPEARAQAEAMLTLANSMGEATAAGKQVELSQERVKERLSESAAFGKSTFTGIAQDLRNGASAGDMLFNVLGKILDKFLELSLNSLFDGDIAGSGGGALGNMFGWLFKGFDDGGWTGGGGTSEPAGVVHGNEFVFDAEATKKAGVQNLYRLMEMLKKPGYEDGGFVSNFAPPSSPIGSIANDNVSDLSTNLRDGGSAEEQRLLVEVAVKMMDDGNLQAFVTNIARQESNVAAKKSDAALSGRLENLRKRRRD